MAKDKDETDVGTTDNVHQLSADLPANRAGLLAQRKSDAKQSINDLVTQVIVQLFENPEFHALVRGTKDEECVEQDILIDDVRAAEMIRAYAVENDIAELRDLVLKVIIHSMRVGMKRFQIGRKERAARRSGTDN